MKNAFSLVLLSIVTILFLPLENMIASDRMLSTMNINGADVMDLSFLKQLEKKKEHKIVSLVPAVPNVSTPPLSSPAIRGGG